jgi:predicted nuclease with TOPRIM domain
MTTFTTEDRENASPPHIVDSGASTIKTLGAYIDLENRIEMYREQLQVMQAENQRLRKRLMELGDNS